MSDAIREAFEAYAEPKGLLEGTTYLPERDAYDWPTAQFAYHAWKAALQSSQTVPAVPEEIMTGIRNVLRMLDEEGGDTDPLCDPEDMRDAYPLIWGHQQLFAILGSLAAPQPDHSPDAGKVVPAITCDEHGRFPCRACDLPHFDGCDCYFCTQESTPEAGKVVRGEPVAKIHRNEAGQISIKDMTGDAFDMSKYVGATMYALRASQQEGEDNDK